jgi:hypothetical protein
MMRFADLLKRNKKDGVSLETLSEAMSQLARIGQSLLVLLGSSAWPRRMACLWRPFQRP